MKLELIGYKICPFVQRCIIALNQKQTEFTMTYIDPMNKPPWFRDIAPTGSVPVMKINESAVLFDSSVINEFINDATPGDLLPRNALRRAQYRAWIVFASECHSDLSNMVVGQDNDFQFGRQELLAKFMRLEEAVSQGPYFGGAAFSLVDAAFAPLFIRINLLNQLHQTLSLADMPRLSAWYQHLLEDDYVQESTVPDLEKLYKAFLIKKKGYVGKLIKSQRQSG
ncbi:MAG: glutathione S-transferase family protein [Magnetococcales bacterium]|nr:glutathione S-transferase family protein [Magnetococcales bacterium]